MKLLLASELTASIDAIRAELSGRGGRLVLVPTAARGEGWEPDRDTHARPFEEMGFEVTELDLAQAGPSRAASALRSADAVYVTGGNTFVLAASMRATGFAEAAAGLLRRGGVYIGSSAGAVAAGPSIAHAAVLDARPEGWSGDDSGLGLVPFNVLPHLGHDEYGASVEAAAAMMRNAEGPSCLALGDGQMAAVEGSTVRIV